MIEINVKPFKYSFNTIFRLWLCICAHMHACVRALEYGHDILATDNALLSFGFNCGSMRFGVRIRIKRVSEKDFMAFNAKIIKYHIQPQGEIK